MLSRVRCALFFILVPLIILPLLLYSWPGGLPVPALGVRACAAIGVTLDSNVIPWPTLFANIATSREVFLDRGTIWPIVGAIGMAIVYWGISKLLCKSSVMQEAGGSRWSGLVVMAWTALTALIVLKVLWWWGRTSLGYSAVQDNWLFMILVWLGRLINGCYGVIYDKSSYASWQVATASIVGVGLCEEFVKMIPLYARGCKGTRTGRMWLGFCSGIGFGVAEAVQYCTTEYDGHLPFLIYLVRFVSVVGFHGLWTGLAASLSSRAGGVPGLFCALIPSMMLHGLFNHACHIESNAFRLTYILILVVCFMALLLIQAKRAHTNVIGEDHFCRWLPSPTVRSTRVTLPNAKDLWRRAKWELSELRWRLSHR